LSAAERKAANNHEKEILIKTRERLHAETIGPSIPPENNPKSVEEIGREAKSLLEQEKYKEAINRLNTAEKSAVDPNEENLARLKEDAVSGLINRERNRAARFFLDSKKLEDPVQKREALFIARDILTDLMLGYPNSSELSKVRQNLKVVEQALESLN
jgi:hypothetical protein